MIKYASEYSTIPRAQSDRAKLSELRTMSRDKRRLVMVSLSNLAKYLGIYEQWTNIRKNNGLKWETRSALEAFVSIPNSNLSDTAEWLGDMRALLILLK